VYCYNSKERAQLKEQTLPLHIAKAGIDYFFAANESRHIRFYGPGEPTQELQLLKSILAYARNKADGVTSEIQTNGCFGKSVREWLLDNLNIIWFSFDGEPDIQNANRPCIGGKPSAPVIEDNVQWFVNNTGSRRLMIGARVTITNANIARQKQIVDYFYSLGIRQVWTDPIFPAVDEIPVCDDEAKRMNYRFDMDAYVDNYIEAYQHGKKKGLFYGSFLACNFDGKCNKHCRACTPTPHFTSDGYVSACDMVTFGENAHHMDCFVYGKWNEQTKGFEFDASKVAALQNRATGNMLHCKQCEAQEHCGGYCLGEVMNETGSMYGQKMVACKAIRRLLAEIGVPGEPYEYLHP
jgi:radical SAM protein with 4Fe4S-binding SPASM domain